MKKDDQARRTFWTSNKLWDDMKQAAALDQRTISGWLRTVIVKAIAESKRG